MNAHINYDVDILLPWDEIGTRERGVNFFIIITVILLFPDLANRVICFKQVAQFNKLSAELLQETLNSLATSSMSIGRKCRQHRAGD